MSEQEELKSAAAQDSARLQTLNGTVSSRTKLFSGLNALGWSAGVAVLTALATFAGMIREAGRSSALALYSLSRPAVDQRDTYRGMSSILSAVIVSLLPFVIAYLVYCSSIWALRKTALYGWLRNRWIKENRFISWLAVIIVVADVGFLNTSVMRLTNQAEAIILKHISEAGTIWTEILLDEDRTAEFGYMFLFGVGMAVFVGVSWWLIDTKIERRLTRLAFLFWAGTQVLFLLFGYSYLIGVTDTIGEFPIVTFSGSEQLPPHSCPVLLGSDDKQFAILVVNCQEKPEGLRKYVLYLPRTEVKWMTVVRVEQLQPFARLDDLKKLSQ
jgi:hypothetical protein